KGDRPKPKISETGFLPKSPTVTKDSQKNPVSRHTSNNSESKIVAYSRRQSSRPNPKVRCFADI
ncbi:hypothetical protein, partial [Microcoleus sp. EPA2]|uniref:hypothetical protein n=1 Tax=Microcoleus sp. EPA2 TaxID=2841654 RepID=UPI00312B9FA5